LDFELWILDLVNDQVSHLLGADLLLSLFGDVPGAVALSQHGTHGSLYGGGLLL